MSGLTIGHNLGAMNALSALSSNQNSLQSALQQLSTGKRINSAADDAAGLAISQKMQAQINGLDQASQNSQDGISLIQTAEGALNETQSILQRMRQLATQSANDTNTSDDRGAMQKEISQLQAEIDNISTTTQFNTKNLLNGSIANNANIQGTDNLNLKSISVVDDNMSADTYKVKTTAAATIGTDISSNTTGLVSTDLTEGTTAQITGLALGNYTLNVNKNSAGTFDLSLVNQNGDVVASQNGWDNSTADALLTGNVNGVSTAFTIKKGDVNLQTGTMDFNLNATYAAAGAFSVTANSGSGATLYSSAANLKLTDSTFQAGGLQFNMTTDVALAAANNDLVNVTNNALTMQIGANENQTMKVEVNKMDSTSLGVNNIDVSTQSGAEAALSSLDTAIQTVSTERSKLGAYENRLQHNINNLSASSQNLTTAQSSITDTNMAATMAQFTKDNVLQQAAVSMLAQANQQPQLVLKLLG